MRNTAKGIIFALVLFLATPAYALDYCKVGADPQWPDRPLAENEEFFVLRQDAPVQVRSGSGNIVACILPNGTEVSALKDNGRIVWVRKCGNDVVSNSFVALREPAPAPHYQDQYGSREYVVLAPRKVMVPYYYRGGYGYSYGHAPYHGYGRTYSYRYGYRPARYTRERTIIYRSPAPPPARPPSHPGFPRME